MTATTTFKRVLIGQPAGGEFAEKNHDESEITLTPNIDAAAVHDNPNDFNEMALNPDTSSAVLDSLVDADHWMVNFWVAANPAISPETQLRLADYPESGVRSHLISNPSVTPETLHALASSGYRDLRAQVAASDKVAIADLSVLAADDDQYVLAQVTVNPLTPRNIIERLAKHPKYVFIREQAAKRLAA